jgi:ABC-type amino acid transport substrate-binding protein
MKNALVLASTALSLAPFATPGFCQGLQSHRAAVVARGTLVVVAFPQQDNPFFSVDLAQGPMQRVSSADHFTGIDVEILKGFAESLGVAMQVRAVTNPSYNDMIPELIRGESDVSMGRTITPEREGLVDFSRPYHTYKRQVLVHKQSSIAGLKDLENRTARIVEGSSQLHYLRGLAIPGLRITPVEFTREGILAVRAREADFSVTDSPVVPAFLREMPELKVAFDLPGVYHYAFPFRKGSDLRDALSAYIESLEKSGALKRLIDSHITRTR